ncbi:hypothetical protein [uncultured Phenylobacterium sp.]|uniref:hypothetical protein n=1 Tax=uncultured Phenylobacterium sp. TaxID=349273 RepID=UPI0025E689D1|nr:hypothetical protein [uncultured Phenylobacterium sp.]
MITFNVVKERHGWAIRLGERMTTPFRSRDLAVREANRLANAIRCHGEHTEVNVEPADRSGTAMWSGGSHEAGEGSAASPAAG